MTLVAPGVGGACEHAVYWKRVGEGEIGWAVAVRRGGVDAGALRGRDPHKGKASAECGGLEGERDLLRGAAQNAKVFVSVHCFGCGMRKEATWPLGCAVTAMRSSLPSTSRMLNWIDQRTLPFFSLRA